MDEFSLIRKYLAPLAGVGGLGLLDDAAIYTPRVGFDLVLTKDSFVEGVHFAKGRYGGDTAERLLRTNLSDLAAKGAQPVGYLLSIAWPDTANIKFFEAFAIGLRDAQHSYDFTLFGGDTVRTNGPMVISATFLGQVPKGTMVKRSGAKVGDDVWVTGSLGGAMLGCRLVTGQGVTPLPSSPDLWELENLYLRPEPRLLFRKTLRKYANACADISDGLLSDAGHICRASNLAMRLEFDAFPLAPAARSWAQSQAKPQTALIKLLSFGDDYELVFTSEPMAHESLIEEAKALGLSVTKIGKVVESGVTQDPEMTQAPVSCFTTNGEVVNFPKTGYSHF
ncbi:MAG: thiamine-phosphate kinase [Litorimonas sp.]